MSAWQHVLYATLAILSLLRPSSSILIHPSPRLARPSATAKTPLRPLSRPSSVAYPSWKSRSDSDARNASEEGSASRRAIDLSSLEGVFDHNLFGASPLPTTKASRHNHIHLDDSLSHNGYDGAYEDRVVTLTETRHLTSYVTTSITNTEFKYITQISTQFVPTIVPTYFTDYVTNVATAYVTQKFPVYRTQYVTEYHTQIHTFTESHTDLRTTTQIDYVTDYVTQTSYVTDTVYLTTTEALHTTFTSLHHVTLPPSTVYQSIYLTSTLSVPFEITSTVLEPTYVTKYVTVEGPETYVTTTLNHYFTDVITYTHPIHHTTTSPVYVNYKTNEPSY